MGLAFDLRRIKLLIRVFMGAVVMGLPACSLTEREMVLGFSHDDYVCEGGENLLAEIEDFQIGAASVGYFREVECDGQHDFLFEEVVVPHGRAAELILRNMEREAAFAYVGDVDFPYLTTDIFEDFSMESIEARGVMLEIEEGFAIYADYVYYRQGDVPIFDGPLFDGHRSFEVENFSFEGDLDEGFEEGAMVISDEIYYYERLDNADNWRMNVISLGGDGYERRFVGEGNLQEFAEDETLDEDQNVTMEMSRGGTLAASFNCEYSAFGRLKLRDMTSCEAWVNGEGDLFLQENSELAWMMNYMAWIYQPSFTRIYAEAYAHIVRARTGKIVLFTF